MGTFSHTMNMNMLKNYIDVKEVMKQLQLNIHLVLLSGLISITVIVGIVLYMRRSKSMKNNDHVKASPKAKLIKDIEPTKHEVPEKKASSWKKPSTVDISPPATKSEANKPDVLQKKSSSWKKPATTPSANGVEQQSSTSSSQKNKSSSSDEKCAVPAIPANTASKTTAAPSQPTNTNTKPSTPDVSN